MKVSGAASFVPDRTLVLIGMMGAGKSTVGRKLAARLALPFVDSDSEIEAAAGMTITQIFNVYGEEEFRKGERRVMARLLNGPICVLAAGGGAFMDHDTQGMIRNKGISIWLKAGQDVLLERALRSGERPLLACADPGRVMMDMLERREPVYATADITVESDGRPVEETADRVLAALETFAQRDE